jgi:hypothetical protein
MRNRKDLWMLGPNFCLICRFPLDHLSNVAEDTSESPVISSEAPDVLRNQIVHAIEMASPTRPSGSKTRSSEMITSSSTKAFTIISPLKPSPSLERLICFEHDLVHEEQSLSRFDTTRRLRQVSKEDARGNRSRRLMNASTHVRTSGNLIGRGALSPARPQLSSSKNIPTSSELQKRLERSVLQEMCHCLASILQAVEEKRGTYLRSLCLFSFTDSVVLRERIFEPPSHSSFIVGNLCLASQRVAQKDKEPERDRSKMSYPESMRSTEKRRGKEKGNRFSTRNGRRSTQYMA